MYYSYFGLVQAPFKITPNTEFFFTGGNRGPILEALIYAISHGEGIVKVTGEVGSGKTMLCNMLQERLPAHVETVYLANPSVSPDEILHAIAFELQLGIDRNATRLEVMQAVHNHLLERHADGKRVVVFVEESQSMPLATLEEIRLLSNLETRNDKLLQIVLFGQPELEDHLRQPSMRPLRERIAHSFRLEPLGAGEIREYLMFRMRTAGYRGPDVFAASVIKYMARASAGLTRRVNLIADKTLLAAFSDNTHTIRLKHVEAAVRDTEFSRHRRAHFEPRYAWSAALVLAGVVIGAASYALLQRGSAASISTATPPVRTESSQVSPVSLESGGPESAGGRGTLSATGNTTGSKSNDITISYAKSSAPAASQQADLEQGTRTASIAPPANVPAPRPSSGAPPSMARESDVVQWRLAATQEWLANERHTTFSIQLLGTADEQQLKRELNTLSKFVEMNRVFVYRTMARQKPSITVLYGSFGSLRAAQDALEKLPPLLQANRPILRTVQGIRTEIRQNQSS
jgi:MSHA biogenesis protein MshM